MSKNIYFCCSIRGGRDDAEWYLKIVEHLKQYGKVLTEHIASPQMSASVSTGADAGMTSAEIHDRDMVWMLEADVVVAEVTVPSLGVGYEIGRAMEMNKPILCLFRPNTGRRLSAMIGGAPKPDNNIVVKTYERIQEAFDHISTFLSN